MVKRQNGKTKTYYQNTQTNEIIEEEPLDWIEAMWYNKVIEFDTSRDFEEIDNNWHFKAFIAPNKLIFTYNMDWYQDAYNE